jgi:phthiodiolone/phenolphthiodiolone dimycocerosates ketoreductase
MQTDPSLRAPRRSAARRLAVGIETSCKAPVRLELLKLRLATAFGADLLFLPDHLQSAQPGFTGAAAQASPTTDAFLEPFVMLGMLAARHRRVQLGTGVTDAFRRHPATVAQAIVTLDHLSGGRAILGIGNGSRENLEPFGIPFVQRVARLEEALTVIRRLWSSRGAPVDFDGRFWRLRGAHFQTPLYAGTAPPVWVAAHAPRMLSLSGRLADGWYPNVKIPPEQYRTKLAAIRSAGEAAGRSMAGFDAAQQCLVVLGPERRRVLESLARHPGAGALVLAMPSSLWDRHGLRHPLGAERTYGDFGPAEVIPALERASRDATPELLGGTVFAGNVTEIAGELQGLAAAGLRHAVVANLTPGFRGFRVDDLLRLAVLIRRLKRIPLLSLQPSGGAQAGTARSDGA